MNNAMKITALLGFGLLMMGSECDDGPPMLSASASTPAAGPTSLTTNPGPADVNRPGDDTTPGVQDPSTGDDAGTPGGDATGTGSLVEGQACQETEACGGGLACEAGFCANAGELRIALVWEGRTDLDLHIMTPNGEEIYYRNRIATDGGEFKKDGCIGDRCEGETGPFSEAVLWEGIPTAGTYEMWAINYDGLEGVSARFEIRHNGQLETFSTQIGAAAGTKSEVFTYAVEGDDAAPGDMNISSHTHEQWVRGPGVTFRVNPGNESITRVNYTTDERFNLGDSETRGDFPLTYTFNNLGERQITARGFDESGMELDNDEITVVVMDQNDGLPNPGQGAVVSDRLLAKRILTHAGSIDLYNVQVSGRNDGADSRSNITAVANGQMAKRSCYGNAPCGHTRLDPRMLQAMVILKQVHGYSFRVTSIAGGSHSRNSRHYRGGSFDVDIINGSRVASNRTRARQFMQVCRNLGATEVLGPGNRGHSSHVHCSW